MAVNIETKHIANIVLESPTTNLQFEVKKTNLTLSQAGVKGAKGDTGDGVTPTDLSYSYFKRAGETAKNDAIFPTEILKEDYNGLTHLVRTINRSATLGVIFIDSIVDEYDYDGNHYEWTTNYTYADDSIVNKLIGSPSVIIT